MTSSYDPRADGGGNPFPSAEVLRSVGANRNIEPDWVLVGWRERGKCHLLASQAVSDASLTFVRQTMHFESWDDFTRPGAFRPARALQAIIGDYALIRADTYAECLAALLFGFQWKPDTIRAIGAAQADPMPPYGAAWTNDPGQGPNSVILCMHRPAGMQLMFCDQPAGHYPDTPHAHTLTWDDDQAGEQPAIEGSETPS